MTDWDFRDEVDALAPKEGRKYGSTQNVILLKLKKKEQKNKTEKKNEELMKEYKEEIAKYFEPGFAVHMNKQQAYTQF